MKKLLLSLPLTLCCLTVFSQSAEYGRFKGDIMGGYAYPIHSDFKFGFVISLEPKYNITSNLAAGLRLEVPGFISNDIDPRILQGVTPTVEYYFGHGKVRPFVGAMAGLYGQLNVEDIDNEDTTPSVVKNYFGAGVRLGAQLGGFRFEVAPNIIPNENSYVSIKLGGTIGGKRK